MEFKEKINELIEKINRSRDHIHTEEATKNAIIMPFLQALGYDVFNPIEVIPEFIADIGVKKGEKVDYAVMKDGKPVLIIECKCLDEELELYNTQLFRYFTVVDAKFALLTNGIRYQFYSDLEKENKMDEKPFLDFNITELSISDVKELEKFHKTSFDIEKIVDTAHDLKATTEIKSILKEEFKNPSDDFVRFLVKRRYQGKVTERVIEFNRDIVKRSLGQIISEMVNDKIQSALDKGEGEEKKEPPIEELPKEDTTEKKIETTQIELEGYATVKAILRSKGVDINRISYKDTLNYLAIILDQSTWKTVCRLWLNARKWYIGLFDTDKKEEKKSIESLNDIFRFENELFAIVQNYDRV